MSKLLSFVISFFILFNIARGNDRPLIFIHGYHGGDRAPTAETGLNTWDSDRGQGQAGNWNLGLADWRDCDI